MFQEINKAPEKIAVVCSVYSARYLGEMINSILAQSYSSWELYLRLDGPPPAETAVIQTAVNAFNDPRIHLLSGENIGIDPSRRTIIDKITEPFFLIIDQDDYLQSDCLEKMYKAIKKDLRIGIVQAGLQTVGEIKQKLYPQKRKIFKGFTVDLLSANQPYLIRRTAYTETSGWTPDPQIFNTGAENDLFLQIEEKYKIVYLHKILYCRRLHNTNQSLQYPNLEGSKYHVHNLVQKQISRRKLNLKLLAVSAQQSLKSSFEQISFSLWDPLKQKKYTKTTKIYNFSSRKETEVFFSLQCPAYHLADLEKLIDSVINQTYKQWELLVCFDDPPDKVLIGKIRKKYERYKQIKFFINEQNKGPGPTRQFLFNQSQARFIIPLDSDDYIEPTLLAEFRQKIIENSNFSIIRAGMKLFSDIMTLDIYPETRRIENNFTIDIFNVHQPYLINAFYLEKVGGWHWDQNFHNSGEDSDLFMRLELLAPIILINKLLYNKRFNIQGIMERTGGPGHLKFLIENMLKLRQLDFQYIGSQVYLVDDKTQKYEIYLKLENNYFCRSFCQAKITPLKHLSKNGIIFTPYLRKYFSVNDLTWKQAFLYPNANCPVQFLKPDILNQLSVREIPYTKKWRIYEMVTESYQPIDIILPVYNNYRELKNCLNSLVRNTRYLFRLLIIDDGSDQPRLLRYYKLIEKYLPFVLIVKNTEKIGYLASINRGIKLSESEQLVLLGSSCSFSEDWLNELVKGFIPDQNVGIVGAANVQASDLAHKNRSGIDFSEMSFVFNYCLLIDRKIFKGNGLFEENFDCAGNYGDIDFCFRAIHNGYKVLLARNARVYCSGLAWQFQPEKLKEENLWKNFNYFAEIWQTHPLYQTIPQELQLIASRSKYREVDPDKASTSFKTNLAYFKILKYDNVSHEVTDRDNLKYFKEYFNVHEIAEVNSQGKLTELFNQCLRDKITYIFLNTTSDPAPLLAYRNFHQLPIYFIFWPYVLIPYLKRYHNLAGLVLPRDIVLSFSKFSWQFFKHLSTNWNLFRCPCLIDNTLYSEKTMKSRSKEIKLLYCGRLIPEKGLGELIKLLGDLNREKKYEYYLDIIAPLAKASPEEQKYYPQLLQAIERAGVADRIAWHGDLSDQPLEKIKIFNQADILFYLSTYSGETFGRAIIEAFAAGCAVVATKWQAVAELITDGENGFLIEVDSANNIKYDQLKKSVQFLSQRKFLEAISQKNRQKALNYDYKRHLPALNSLCFHGCNPDIQDQEKKLILLRKIKFSEEISRQKAEFIQADYAVQIGLFHNSNQPWQEPKAKEKIDLIYFGQEFCEELIPADETIKKVAAFCQENSKQFVLVLPSLTEKYLKRAEKILEIIPSDSGLIINDWGLAEMVKNSAFSLSLGRQLVKAKRDPRFFPKEFKSYFSTNNLQANLLALLSHYKITRVELDNIKQNYDLPEDLALKSSLYFPYVYISKTRKCLNKNQGQEQLAKISVNSDCAKTKCNNIISLKLANYAEDLYFINSAFYYLNVNMPNHDILKRYNTDRIIIENKNIY